MDERHEGPAGEGPGAELTRALREAGRGEAGAADRLAELLYRELRGMARREMAGERGDHTLQPTALVHEAYLRLAPGPNGGFESRAHFLAAGAVAIRRVLVDHARRRSSLKRGGDHERVELDEAWETGGVQDEALLALDVALERLAEISPDHARTVELRFFAGMTGEEIAALRGVSPSTVQREWRFARAWLRGELEGSDGP
jgi:RNA polymerase sigma factor (TIGR02999 family)